MLRIQRLRFGSPKRDNAQCSNEWPAPVSLSLRPETKRGVLPRFVWPDRSACEWVGREGQVQFDRLGLAKE